MYVKATQTDMVSMETFRNDDEDEDSGDVVVQTVSSSATAPSEPEKVLLTLSPFLPPSHIPSLPPSLPPSPSFLLCDL